MTEFPPSNPEKLNTAVLAVQQEVLAYEPGNQPTNRLRNKMLSITMAGAIVAGGVVAGEYATIGEAQAETIAYSDLGYPDASMPCEHSPYNVAGACANYDWGPTHTATYNDPSEYSSRGYAYRNCTDYVAWKLGALGASVPHNLGNGGDWYNHAQESQKATTPKAGDAAVKPTSSSDAYGHVAYVESVNDDGTITVSEYNHDVKGDGDTRTGTASSMGFTEFVDFGVHPSGTSGGSSSGYTDGQFLHTTDTGNVYEMAGGAPIRLFNWGEIPEFHGQATDVTQAQVNSMPAYPKDGTFVNIAEAGGNGIYEFVGGAPIRQYNWGILNGFGSRPVEDINYQSLQVLDHMRLTPTDGSFANIHEAGGNGIYEFVGGAPIRQYNWGILNGFPGGAITDINYQSLQTLDHMHAVPNNGSFMNIHEAGGNGVYEFIGGAPIRQYNWGILPGFPGGSMADVNYQSLQVLDHMNPVPSDGTFVNIQEAGGNGVYEFVGGAPLRQYNWGILPGFGNPPSINYQSLVNLDHMNAVPSNGEFVASAETGAVYRTAGGASLKLYNQGGIPGYNGALWVNQQTLDTYDHLNAVPADGTVLEGVSSQTYWQIQGGNRVATAPNNSAIVVDEQTIVDIPS